MSDHGTVVCYARHALHETVIIIISIRKRPRSKLQTDCRPRASVAAFARPCCLHTLERTATGAPLPSTGVPCRSRRPDAPLSIRLFMCVVQVHSQDGAPQFSTPVHSERVESDARRGACNRYAAPTRACRWLAGGAPTLRTTSRVLHCELLAGAQHEQPQCSLQC